MMKVNQKEIKNKSKEITTGCCESTNTSTNKKAEPCCEQPADGSSCCDENGSKEKNTKVHSCC